jgi:SAM-dependent methyltransferase
VVPFIDFVLSHLPLRPARVLEVGCGDGDLARALAATGYDVTAIDPEAPEGEIFRRIRLEELEYDARFDAVVASRVFHHLPLEASFARVARALEGGGPLILDEFAWDRFDAPTADWYEGQRRVLLAALQHHRAPSAAEWEDHHLRVHDVHRFEPLRAALDEHFEEVAFEWVPYLWHYLGGPATLELEESLIAVGAIQPLGWRYVGIPVSAPSLS